jgi:hypothetical protein
MRRSHWKTSETKGRRVRGAIMMPKNKMTRTIMTEQKNDGRKRVRKKKGAWMDTPEFLHRSIMSNVNSFVVLFNV